MPELGLRSVIDAVLLIRANVDMTILFLPWARLHNGRNDVRHEVETAALSLGIKPDELCRESEPMQPLPLNNYSLVQASASMFEEGIVLQRVRFNPSYVLSTARSDTRQKLI